MAVYDIVVIDSSDQRVEKIHTMFHKHPTIMHIRSVEKTLEILRKMKKSDSVKVVIWHLSASKFQGKQISYFKLGSIIKDYLEKHTSFDYKFGVSNNHKFWPYADKTGWFSIKTMDWDNFDALFRKDNGEYCLSYGLKKLPVIREKENVKNIISYIIKQLLPFDIDMQALEILVERKKKGEKAKDPQEYLKAMYADNTKYIDKLIDLQKKASELAETGAVEKEKLNGLIGISHVKKFFKKLDRRVTAPDELLNHDWGIKKVNSFHDWYCALTSCLRGKGAC